MNFYIICRQQRKVTVMKRLQLRCGFYKLQHANTFCPGILENAFKNGPHKKYLVDFSVVAGDLT